MLSSFSLLLFYYYILCCYCFFYMICFVGGGGARVYFLTDAGEVGIHQCRLEELAYVT